jgi:hypothetical protein
MSTVAAAGLLLAAAPAGAAGPDGDEVHPQGVDAKGASLRPDSPAAAAGLSAGPPITRSEIIARAETWMHPPVPYSQEAYKNGYRTDCSGYVSMAWKTNGNYWTGNLHEIGVPIAYASLQPGDMLLYHNPANPVNGSHVVIFDRWVGAVNGDFYIYEQTPPATKHRTWSSTGRSRTPYKPYRYVNVIDGSGGGTTITGRLPDINQDGKADIVGRLASGYAEVSHGTGPDLFAPPVGFGSGWNVYTAIFIADINQDGKNDIIGRLASGYAEVSHGTGPDLFAPPVGFGSGWNVYTGIFIADINHDGRNDIIGRRSNGTVEVSHGTGPDQFASPVGFGSGWNTYTAIP